MNKSGMLFWRRKSTSGSIGNQTASSIHQVTRGINERDGLRGDDAAKHALGDDHSFEIREIGLLVVLHRRHISHRATTNCTNTYAVFNLLQYRRATPATHHLLAMQFQAMLILRGRRDRVPRRAAPDSII